MTDVLARARDLMSKAAEEPWNGSLQKALTEKFQQLASAGGGDSVNDDGSVLAHFRNADNRAASFTTNGGWPLAKPCVADLVKHGFFYAPLPGCEDRVACHACGKVLFNWDPDDEILDAHRLFSPDCALVTGKSLEPLPEEGAAGEESKPAWAAAATIAHGAAGETITANLSSFVETLRQTASSVDVEDLVKRAKPGKKKKKNKEDGEFPTAKLASDSEQTHSEGEGGAKLLRHEGSKKASSKGAEEQSRATAQNRSDRLWRFDWSTPSAGGSTGGGGILDAQTGELEMRLATARQLMLDHKDDWFAAGLQVEAACREMESKFGQSMDEAGRRMDSMGAKAAVLSGRVAMIKDDELLAKRAGELEKQHIERDTLLEEKMATEVTLAELRAHTDAERADIDLIKDKIEKNRVLDGEIEGKQRTADEAVARASDAEERLAEALRKKVEMEASMVRVRDELRDEISLLHATKLGEETALGEAQEQMLRTKRLYGEYKDRLGELQRREALCEEREKEMRLREENVSRRENTLKARDEWMSKRESEFRIQQRALENNLSVPRMAVLPGTSSPDDGRGGGSGGSSAASGSRGVDLADQVMQAQAEWATRPNQAMGMAAGKGKAGAKEAAQRDYKAILSTTDTSDPQQEREAAKASRRKEITSTLSGMIGLRKKSSKGAKAPAAGFFDMNTI